MMEKKPTRVGKWTRFITPRYIWVINVSIVDDEYENWFREMCGQSTDEEKRVTSEE
jgi:hypothetical protein